jgi:hypothetical protein
VTANPAQVAPLLALGRGLYFFTPRTGVALGFIEYEPIEVTDLL